MQAHCDVFAARMLDCKIYRYNVMYSRKKTRMLSCLLYTVVYTVQVLDITGEQPGCLAVQVECVNSKCTRTLYVQPE